MDVMQLYALYRAGHEQARRSADEFDIRPTDLVVRAGGLTALESVILELALHDVTNGTAMRSPARFERAVEQGADLLRSLGLRIDRPQGDGLLADYRALDEAA